MCGILSVVVVSSADSVPFLIHGDRERDGKELRKSSDGDAERDLQADTCTGS